MEEYEILCKLRRMEECLEYSKDKEFTDRKDFERRIADLEENIIGLIEIIRELLDSINKLNEKITN